MIFDRTKSDVISAKNIRANKVQKFIELTESERETLERGMVTANTLNRIESKQAELKIKFDDMGYYGSNISNKTWQSQDIFNELELERIFKNNGILRDAFLVFKNTPQNPVAKYGYEEFNFLEKILFDLEAMVSEVEKYIRECDTFYCGEE